MHLSFTISYNIVTLLVILLLDGYNTFYSGLSEYNSKSPLNSPSFFKGILNKYSQVHLLLGSLISIDFNKVIVCLVKWN